MNRMCLLVTAGAVSLVSPHAVAAQTSGSDAEMTRVVERLFAGMLKTDTAAVRASFLAGGRVIPIPQPGTATKGVSALSVDDFVKFAGNNPAGTWRERFWNATTRTTGALGHLWFDYSVLRGDSLSHCGTNSVQLQQTPDGWKIISMAFTSRRTDCEGAPEKKPALHP